MFDWLKQTKLRRFVLCVEQREFVEALCYVITRLGFSLPAPMPRSRPRAHAHARVNAREPERGTRLVATVHSLELEGAPLSLLEILGGLIRESGYEIHLISPRRGPLDERARSLGCTIHVQESPQNESGGGRDYERRLTQFAELLTSLDPDVVFANSMATFHAVDAAWSIGVPSLWLIREGDSPRQFFSLYPRAVQARGLACLDYPFKTAFVSKATMEQWPKNHTQQTLIRTIPDRAAISTLLSSWTRDAARRALKLNDADFVVLTVGTLCSNKGQLDLIKATTSLAKAPTRIRLLLVGAVVEPGGSAIVRAIARLSGPQRELLFVHDATPDIGKYYAAADAYVCSSRCESYPRSILEALAFRLPIISTAVGGIPEALCGAESLSYQAGDVAALSSLILDLATSIDMRMALATSSQQRWSQILRDDNMIESYSNEVDELLGRAD